MGYKIKESNPLDVAAAEELKRQQVEDWASEEKIEQPLAGSSLGDPNRVDYAVEDRVSEEKIAPAVGRTFEVMVYDRNTEREEPYLTDEVLTEATAALEGRTIPVTVGFDSRKPSIGVAREFRYQDGQLRAMIELFAEAPFKCFTIGGHSGSGGSLRIDALGNCEDPSWI